MEAVADALVEVFTSENVADANNNGNANVVDALDAMTQAARRIAAAITPNIAGGPDATGCHVESLTEAVVGMTSGLVGIARAIEHLAEAVENFKD